MSTGIFKKFEKVWEPHYILYHVCFLKQAVCYILLLMLGKHGQGVMSLLAAPVVWWGQKHYAVPATSAVEFVNAGMPAHIQNTTDQLTLYILFKNPKSMWREEDWLVTFTDQHFFLIMTYSTASCWHSPVADDRVGSTGSYAEGLLVRLKVQGWDQCFLLQTVRAVLEPIRQRNTLKQFKT